MNKPIVASLALVALTFVVGCASAGDRLCEENQKCEGATDPAQECADLRAECDEDDECAASQEQCKAENEVVAACVLAAESSCRELGEASFYLPNDEEACSEELDAFLECIG